MNSSDSSNNTSTKAKGSASDIKSQRQRSQRSKGASGGGGGGSSSSSSSALPTYAAATASSLAAGGPSNPAPPAARPSSATARPKMNRLTKSRISATRSDDNDRDEKENVPARKNNRNSNPSSSSSSSLLKEGEDANENHVSKETPSKRGGGNNNNNNNIDNNSPAILSPTPYWKVLHERGDDAKTSPRMTRSASKKASTPNANHNNHSFERRMQELDELDGDEREEDDDDDDASDAAKNNIIDPTLLHFSPYNKQFEIESARNSKRRHDAELQKEQVWTEKAREQLGGGGGGANKRMAKRAKRGMTKPLTQDDVVVVQATASSSSSTSEAMATQKIMLEKAVQDGNEWMERARQWEGQCEMHKAKYEVVSSELDFAKSEVRRLQDANTEHAVALALLQSKLDQTIDERNSAIERAELAEAAKDEAVKEALAKDMSNADADEQLLSDMKVKYNDLKSRLETQRAIEEEICKLFDVDIALVEFTTPEVISTGADDHASNEAMSAKTMFLDMVKSRLEEYQSHALMKEDLEKRLQSCAVEFEKVKADYQALKISMEVKDRDMSELMKSVSDIQRCGQVREEGLTNRLEAAERQVVQCREKILALGFEKKSLEEALEAAKSACTTHEIAIASLRKEISDSRLGSTYHDSKLQLERDCLTKAEEKAREELDKQIALSTNLNAQLTEHVQSEKQLRESMESMRRNMTEQIHLLEQESENKDREIMECREIIAGLEAHQLSLEKSLSEQQSIMEASKEEEIGRLKGEIANLESRLMSEVSHLQNAGMANEAKVQELESLIRQSVLERKRMHNIIQELRGNVRVFARIRPMLSDDDEQECDGKTPSVSHFGDEQVAVANLNNPSQRHEFSFDRVFAPSAGQEDVFSEVSELVQSTLDGYNVCIFSYGQTGSGKTHTMQGAGSGVMRGLIPRCLEQIGLHKVAEEKDGWEFTMEVSFLEIYNESLKDLLRANVSQECRHEIKVGSDGRRTVTDLTVKVIDPNDQVAVDGILALAAKRRATGSTDMNATSSRSHSVFTLNITARHVERNQVVRGTLNLVDLAGSERLDRSNATGQRQKETVAINKSLSSLVDVFTAIGQKSSHVPFRNSKLTFLLQPALSGDGKTCMIVNLSPTEASVPETLCSLRFASKVNMCELGKAKRTIEELKSESSAQSNSSLKSGAVSRNVKRKL